MSVDVIPCSLIMLLITCCEITSRLRSMPALMVSDLSFASIWMLRYLHISSLRRMCSVSTAVESQWSHWMIDYSGYLCFSWEDFLETEVKQYRQGFWRLILIANEGLYDLSSPIFGLGAETLITQMNHVLWFVVVRTSHLLNNQFWKQRDQVSVVWFSTSRWYSLNIFYRHLN